MKIASIDRNSWIQIEVAQENNWPSFTVEAYVDIGHGRFHAVNADVALEPLGAFAAELDRFILDRSVVPRLTGTYGIALQFRAVRRAVLLEFVVGDAFAGYTQPQHYALTGGFEIEEGMLLSLVAAFQQLAGQQG